MKTGQKETVRIFSLGLLILFCFLSTWYFHHFLKTEIVFTHFFYIPIFLAAFWWPRAGLLVPAGLALMVLISHEVSRPDITLFWDAARSVMFLVAGATVSILSGRISSYAEKLGSDKKTLEQRVEEQTNQTRELQQKQQAILDGIGDAVLVQDGELNIIWANKVAGEKYGLTPGKKCYQVLQKSNRPCAGCLSLKTFQDGAIRSAESEVFHRGGEKGSVIFNCAPIRDSGGNVVSVINVLHDIADRKRLEDQLRSASVYARNLIEASLDPMVTISPEGMIQDVNKATEQVTGISRDRLIGSDFSSYFTEPVKAREGYQRVLSEGMIRDYQLAIRHASGSLTEVAYNAILYRDEAGEIKGIFAAARDITVDREAQRELRFSEEKMRKLTAHLESVREDERTAVAREIHDELGQALTALKMDLSWLSDRVNGKDALKRKTTSMIRLIDSTIKSVRTISAQLRPGMLDDLGISAAVEWLANDFQKRTAISCKVTVQPDDIILDGARSTAIYRIFQEALTNISRHSHATTVDCHLIRKKHTMFLIVSDNGIGINKNGLSGMNSFGIMGIRERVRMLDGRFRIWGTPGIGTTMIVTISLKGEEEHG